MIKREGHRVIFSDLAIQRIKDNCCPSCGRKKSEWVRRKDWRCCSTQCTLYFSKNMVEVEGWDDLRSKCFNRDGHKCKVCGKSKELVADHIIPISLGGQEWDINNLQSLCVDCHHVKTREDMKSIVKQRRVEKVLKKGQKTIMPYHQRLNDEG